MRFFALVMVLSASASAEEAPAKPKEYEITAKLDPAAVAPGGSAKVVITIAPKGEYVAKTETPFKALLSATGDVKLRKSEFSAKDFDDPKAAAKSISTTVTAGGAGQQVISADLTFFLCTEQLCQRFKDKVALPLSVK